jgi:hypothetical protein
MLRPERCRRVDSHPDVVVGGHPFEPLVHREVPREHGLRFLHAVFQHHDIADRDVGEHHRQPRAVGECRGPVLPALVDVELVVRLGHFDDPPVGLSGMGLQHLGALDARAVAHVHLLGVLDRLLPEHFNCRLAGFDAASVGAQYIGDVKPFLAHGEIEGLGGRGGGMGGQAGGEKGDSG